MKSYSQTLLRLRIPVLGLIALLVLAALWRASTIENDNSLHIWFEEGDENYARYLDFLETWKSDEVVLIGFQADDLFSAERLRWLDSVTEKIAGVSNIRKVTSLTNVENMYGVEDGLVVEPLVAVIPETPEELAALRRRAFENPWLRGYLLSEDGRATAIEARIDKTEVGPKRKMEQELRELAAAEEEATGIRMHMTGVPILDAAFDRYTEEDYARNFPLMIGALFLVLLFANASLAGVMVPLIASLVPMVLTVGLFALSGGAMNMLTSMVFVVLLALTVGDSLHLVNHYQQETTAGASRFTALQATVRALALPCLFTSLTTAAGFASFSTSRMAALGEVGRWTAVGVLLAYCSAMTLVPALLSVLPQARLRQRSVDLALLDGIGVWPTRWPRTIVAVTAVLVLAALAGVTRLRTETDNLEYFPSHSEIRVGQRFIEENLAGSVPVEVVIRGPADFVKEPDILQRLESIENQLEALPEGRRAFSIAGLVKELNVALNGGNRAFDTLPEDRSAVGQYLLLYELSGGDELADFVTTSYDLTRVTGFINQTTSERLRDIVAEVDRSLEEGFPRGVEARVEGVASLWSWLDTYLLESQVRSFGLAFVVISAMMAICLRSVRLAVITMIPNTVPIVITLGFMGWTGIRLDTGTVLVAAVSIGLVVDNTIHYVVRFREQLEKEGEHIMALRATVRITGRPILYSSAILVLGFLVTTTSSFRPIVYFGGLTSLTLALGLIANLLLLPALLVLWRSATPPAHRNEPERVAAGGGH